jgi:putative GTP pyrophosphokinase
VPEPPSRRSIDRAGELLRQWWRDEIEDDLADPELRRAVELVASYRETFDTPLRAVGQRVRRYVRTQGGGTAAIPLVSTRLKRLPTIVDKLSRIPGMKLSRMHDIGGCRAVLPKQVDVTAVLERLQKALDGKVRDYVAKPKPTGYRAVHLIAKQADRLIEIQLRTQLQHEWAWTVERLAGQFGPDLKDGHGPPDLLRFLEMAATGMDLEANGLTVDDTFRKEFEQVARKARAIIES